MEEILKATGHRRVVRVGGTVRRSMYPWSSSIHLLLQHLESVGFPSAPRFLGIDDEGREVLSFVEGVAGAEGSKGPGFGAHVWAMVVPDEGLARFARLLREYHQAVAGFAPPAGAAWATGQGAPGPGEIVCHNDFVPWNVVWRDSTPVGVIDWDYAAPAPPLDDVAYALEWSIPFASDEECLSWRRFAVPPLRRHRLEVFGRAYGLTTTDGVIDAVIARQHKFRATVTQHAEQGIQPAIDEVASGYLDIVDARIQWAEANRQLFE
jgi:hypothetical protein